MNEQNNFIPSHTDVRYYWSQTDGYNVLPSYARKTQGSAELPQVCSRIVDKKQNNRSTCPCHWCALVAQLE